MDDADVGTTQMENTRSPIQNDDVSNASIDPKQERFTLLLYLINKDVFLDEGDTVTGIVQAAKDLKIDIVLYNTPYNLNLTSDGMPYSVVTSLNTSNLSKQCIINN